MSSGVDPRVVFGLQAAVICSVDQWGLADIPTYLGPLLAEEVEISRDSTLHRLGHIIHRTLVCHFHVGFLLPLVVGADPGSFRVTMNPN